MPSPAAAKPVVIAPHYRWFAEWCRKAGLRPAQARYAASPDALLGMHDAEITIVDRLACRGSQLATIREALALESAGCVTLRWESTR